MAMPKKNSSRAARPDYMVRLGLAPPYTEADVSAAYRNKAKQVHPDHGGSQAEFHALHEAYERAKQYLEFKGDRRHWIAGQMEGYLSVRQLIDRLEEFGAEVTSNAIDWLEQSFGDFAQLTESITGVRLTNSSSADKMVAAMVSERSALDELTRLELPGCQISDDSVLALEAFQQLKHLDLSGTPISAEALWIVDTVLGLESLELKGTKVGWWMRRKVNKVMRQRREAKPATPFS